MLEAIAGVVRQRLGRPPALVLAALGFCVVLLLAAVSGDSLAPHSASAQNLAVGVSKPTSSHLLGTDDLGRDVLSRLMAGASVALTAPMLVALGTTVIAGLLGLWAGYRGGWIDSVVARVADVVYSMPALLVALVVIGVLGNNYWLTVGILIFLSCPAFIRVVRAAVMVQSQLPYIDATRVLGLSQRRVMVRHLLPNVLPTLIATALLDFVGALLAFSALAFLGVGVEPGQPDWGSMVADGQALIYQNPWMSLAPAALIVLTAVSVTVLGDWIYDTLSERKGH